MRKLNILLVEDNEMEATLFKEVLSQLDLAENIDHKPNGSAAFIHLQQMAKNKKSALPNLIIMDLNMPIMDGQETLAAIKSDPDLRHIPVILLTTNNEPKNVRLAYQHCANAYLIKPDNAVDMEKMGRAIRDFWGLQVVFPI
ncbi:MAG: response regulator [Cryomorphaceae bacterium]|nr:response regulator [Cryomorphaceae bacterium]